MKREKIESLLKVIFSEANIYKNNYLVESPFWIRHTVRGGCNHGDQYSTPNISAIANAIMILAKEQE